MTVTNFDISKDSILASGKDGVVATVSVDGNVLFTATLMRDSDGSLYYHLFDEADLDGAFAIEGHLPEYFDDEGGE
jgi:hypothetical protein